MQVANNVKVVKEKKQFEQNGKITEYYSYSILVTFNSKDGIRESLVRVSDPTGKVKMLDQELQVITWSEK